MGQFSVEDKFPFSVIILELEISAFPPWHLLSARSGCLSMCVCVFVTNNNRICLKKKKKKKQALFSLVTPSLPFFGTHHVLHEVESESHPHVIRRKHIS